MLIHSDASPDGLEERGLHWWAGERFVIGWKGHFVLGDRTAGAASAAALAQVLEQRPLAAACADTLGVFGLFIWDRRDGSWQVAGDNSGLYKIFHDAECDRIQRIGTSFLELCRARGLRAADAQPEALVEYLAHGGLFGGRTFFAAVRELGADQVLRLDRGPPRLTQETKRLAAPESDAFREDAPEFIIDYFDRLAASLRARWVSVDLTGGFDSRLIAVLLSRYGLDLEAAMSGEADSPDVLLARRVAEALGLPFFVTHQDLDQLEEELPQILADGDGLTEIPKFHRDRQMALARRARGVEVFLHGGGGGHFNDFFFHHEFPRYGRTDPAIARFYDLRVAPVRLPNAHLTPEGAALMQAVRERTLALFAQMRATTNHETYDRIGYFIRAPETYGHQLSSYINLGLDVVTPFAEHRNVLRAMRLPPWSRFMHRWHRALITRYRPDVAALPTTDGYSASTAPEHVAGNLRRFGGNELRRLVSKTSQRLLGCRLLAKPGADRINAADFLPRLRATPQLARALDLLKEQGILAAELRAEQVRDVHVGRLLTAGMCLAALDAAAITLPFRPEAKPIARPSPAHAHP
jgi:asparagine synthase (glutamine-hydrolysing)